MKKTHTHLSSQLHFVSQSVSRVFGLNMNGNQAGNGRKSSSSAEQANTLAFFNLKHLLRQG